MSDDSYYGSDSDGQSSFIHYQSSGSNISEAVFHNIPDPVHCFIGDKNFKYADTIIETLNNPQSSQPFHVILGSKGLGKTSLVTYIAHSFVDQLEDTSTGFDTFSDGILFLDTMKFKKQYNCQTFEECLLRAIIEEEECGLTDKFRNETFDDFIPLTLANLWTKFQEYFRDCLLIIDDFDTFANIQNISQSKSSQFLIDLFGHMLDNTSVIITSSKKLDIYYNFHPWQTQFYNLEIWSMDDTLSYFIEYTTFAEHEIRQYLPEIRKKTNLTPILIFSFCTFWQSIQMFESQLKNVLQLYSEMDTTEMSIELGLPTVMNTEITQVNIYQQIKEQSNVYSFASDGKIMSKYSESSLIKHHTLSIHEIADEEDEKISDIMEIQEENEEEYDENTLKQITFNDLPSNGMQSNISPVVHRTYHSNLNIINHKLLASNFHPIHEDRSSSYNATLDEIRIIVNPNMMKQSSIEEDDMRPSPEASTSPFGTRFLPTYLPLMRTHQSEMSNLSQLSIQETIEQMPQENIPLALVTIGRSRSNTDENIVYNSRMMPNINTSSPYDSSDFQYISGCGTSASEDGGSPVKRYRKKKRKPKINTGDLVLTNNYSNNSGSYSAELYHSPMSRMAFGTTGYLSTSNLSTFPANMGGADSPSYMSDLDIPFWGPTNNSNVSVKNGGKKKKKKRKTLTSLHADSSPKKNIRWKQPQMDQFHNSVHVYSHSQALSSNKNIRNRNRSEAVIDKPSPKKRKRSYSSYSGSEKEYGLPYVSHTTHNSRTNSFVVLSEDEEQHYRKVIRTQTEKPRHHRRTSKKFRDSMNYKANNDEKYCEFVNSLRYEVRRQKKKEKTKSHEVEEEKHIIDNEEYQSLMRSFLYYPGQQFKKLTLNNKSCDDIYPTFNAPLSLLRSQSVSQPRNNIFTPALMQSQTSHENILSLNQLPETSIVKDISNSTTVHARTPKFKKRRKRKHERTHKSQIIQHALTPTIADRLSTKNSNSLAFDFFKRNTMSALLSTPMDDTRRSQSNQCIPLSNTLTIDSKIPMAIESASDTEEYDEQIRNLGFLGMQTRLRSTTDSNLNKNKNQTFTTKNRCRGISTPTTSSPISPAFLNDTLFSITINNIEDGSIKPFPSTQPLFDNLTHLQNQHSMGNILKFKPVQSKIKRRASQPSIPANFHSLAPHAYRFLGYNSYDKPPTPPLSSVCGILDFNSHMSEDSMQNIDNVSVNESTIHLNKIMSIQLLNQQSVDDIVNRSIVNDSSNFKIVKQKTCTMNMSADYNMNRDRIVNIQSSISHTSSINRSRKVGFKSVSTSVTAAVMDNASYFVTKYTNKLKVGDFFYNKYLRMTFIFSGVMYDSFSRIWFINSIARCLRTEDLRFEMHRELELSTNICYISLLCRCDIFDIKQLKNTSEMTFINGQMEVALRQGLGKSELKLICASCVSYRHYKYLYEKNFLAWINKPLPRAVGNIIGGKDDDENDRLEYQYSGASKMQIINAPYIQLPMAFGNVKSKSEMIDVRNISKNRVKNGDNMSRKMKKKEILPSNNSILHWMST